MSKMTIVQAKSISATEADDRTAVITVTAEDGSQSVFRIVFEIVQKPDATDLVSVDDTANKMLKNGTLIIQKANRTYTAAGAEL